MKTSSETTSQKSPGQVACEALYRAAGFNIEQYWPQCTLELKDAWESVAQSVIDDYLSRHPEPPQPTPKP